MNISVETVHCMLRCARVETVRFDVRDAVRACGGCQLG